MTKQEFEAYMERYADQIERIRQSAHELHQSVNQTYGDLLPYGYHLDMVVNGMDVFGFAIKQPPRSLKELIATFNIDVETVDLLLLHQANRFIDEKIRKAIKIPPEKTPYCLEEYGNVTSASIPLTMVTRCQDKLSGDKEQHCLACGFGVGLAWASMEFYAGGLKMSDVITY
jgi:3-oxoacyl-[acyl-carrier-protein] synthase-3